MKSQTGVVTYERGKSGEMVIDRKQVPVLLALIAVIFMAGCITPETERAVTEAESKEIARVFVENSPTYLFDGFDLTYNQTVVLRCPYCWMFSFEFKSRHAGYGNRTGQVLAQVTTPHTAMVTVINGTITRAILDERWDMLTQTSVSNYDNPAEAQAREIAKNYVLSMDEYQNFSGKDLKVTNVIQAQCPGCWQIELEFYLTSEKDPERTDRATVRITLENGEIVDTFYAQGGVPSEKLTFVEALARAQNSACVQEGTLTDNYFYNENTRTWWIDLDPYTERKGCNPACVVYEETKTVEINWRCTGALPPEQNTKNETCITETGEIMSFSEALKIADASACVEQGMLTTNYFCNPVTGTWWIDLDPFTKMEGCHPACVVNMTTKTAEINWRCTGLLNAK